MFAQLLRRGIHVWRLTAVCQAYYTIGGFVISLLEGIIRRQCQYARLPVAVKPTGMHVLVCTYYEGPICIIWTLSVLSCIVQYDDDMHTVRTT